MLQFLLLSQLRIYLLVYFGRRRYISDLGFAGRHIQLLDHEVEGKPYVLIVTLFKCVELAVIGAPVSINLGVLVPLEDPAHRPFAIDKAAVSHLQVFLFKAAGASDQLHFLAYRKYTVTLVHDDELSVRLALWVVAIAQPAKSVGDLTVPRGVFFPTYFLHVFYRVKGKVYSQRYLKALAHLVIKAYTT